MNNTSNLPPCPFCGEKAVKFDEAQDRFKLIVKCQHCHASNDATTFYNLVRMEQPLCPKCGGKIIIDDDQSDFLLQCENSKLINDDDTEIVACDFCIPREQYFEFESHPNKQYDYRIIKSIELPKINRDKIWAKKEFIMARLIETQSDLKQMAADFAQNLQKLSERIGAMEKIISNFD